MANGPRQTTMSSGHMAILPVQETAPGEGDPARLDTDAFSLERLASDIRRIYSLSHEIRDDALLASLLAVTRKSDRRARWLAIFNSPLGRALSENGCDLSTALGDILAALPAPRS